MKVLRAKVGISPHPAIYPARHCGEQRQTFIFPPQQPSVASRLPPAAARHDCSGSRMLSCLSGETEANLEHGVPADAGTNVHALAQFCCWRRRRAAEQELTSAGALKLV